jgi:uncharacterized protein with NRDE domain
MCTLIAIHRQVPGRWLVVAANRDEFLDRPAEGPAIRPGASGPILAPLDARAGGTWLGLNRGGVFAALTNLRAGDPDPTMKSRGTVVTDALGLGSADAAAGALARLPERAFNAFNCYVADAESAYLVTYHESAEVHALSPGVHVVGNADAAAAARASRAGSHEAAGQPILDPHRDVRQQKVDRVRARASAAADLPADDVLDALAGICREHGTGETSLADTCVHMAATYGTRSSILLELSDVPDESRLLYAEGAPCAAPYEDFSSLLSELRRSPGYGSAEKLTRTAS